jgi:hypothetical protein
MAADLRGVVADPAIECLEKFTPMHNATKGPPVGCAAWTAK